MAGRAALARGADAVCAVSGLTWVADAGMGAMRRCLFTASPLLSGAEFVGRVVSNRMQKTVVVAVDRQVWYPKQKQLVRRTSKHFAHDEDQACDIGDVVRIHWIPRRSKHKHYTVVEVLQKMDVFSAQAGADAAASHAGASALTQVQHAQAQLQEARQRLAKARELFETEVAARREALPAGAGGAGGSS